MIRKHREEKKWTQEGFADQIEMHRAHYGRIERGGKDVQISTLERIAAELGAIRAACKEPSGRSAPRYRRGAGTRYVSARRPQRLPIGSGTYITSFPRRCGPSMTCDCFVWGRLQCTTDTQVSAWPKRMLDPDPYTAATGCFLCEPPPDLTYRKTADGLAISGLGPLVDGYSVVAAVPHVRSAADAAAGGAPAFLPFAERVRARLIQTYGSCLLTEHGRMPVCVDSVGAERHCYHAHFLCFPAVPAVVDAARGYFDTARELSELSSALSLARTFSEYFLLSPNPQQFFVFANQRSVPRQFARTLVAAAIGKVGEAAWQSVPRREEARDSASRLRTLFDLEI